MTGMTVTQADREAYLSLSMLPEFDAADVRAGLWDRTTGLQAFAAHRIAALEEAAKVAEGAAPESNAGSVANLTARVTARAIADQIRTLKGTEA